MIPQSPSSVPVSWGDDPTPSREVAKVNRIQRTVDLLAALADPARLRIVEIVAARGEVCSCDLLAPLARSQSTVSHHTSTLARAGILVGRKRGRWTWWSVDTRVVDELREALSRCAPVVSTPRR